MKRARGGEGNRCGFLECQTHRALGHNVKDAQVYRDPQAALARLRADDPIQNYERRCLEEGWLTRQDFDAVNARVDAMVEEARQFAVESPYPDPAELYTDIYD